MGIFSGADKRKRVANEAFDLLDDIRMNVEIDNFGNLRSLALRTAEEAEWKIPFNAPIQPSAIYGELIMRDCIIAKNPPVSAGSMAQLFTGTPIPLDYVLWDERVKRHTKLTLTRYSLSFEGYMYERPDRRYNYRPTYLCSFTIMDDEFVDAYMENGNLIIATIDEKYEISYRAQHGKKQAIPEEKRVNEALRDIFNGVLGGIESNAPSPY